MHKLLSFHNKAVEIELSKSASLQSSHLNSILVIEIQVYFSCLLGKRLAFYTESKVNGIWQLNAEEFSAILAESQQLTKNIYIRFNTVMTKSCPVSDYIGPPPVTDFTIKNQKPYVPCWLNIDYKNDNWSGEYGWHSSKEGQANTKQVRGQAFTA